MALWRYSPRDGRLLAVALLQLGLGAWALASWPERRAGEIALLLPVAVLLSWYGAVVVAHNFLHTPWFVSPRLNRLTAILLTLNLGVPLELCRAHHANHHRHGNDRPEPGRAPRDHSSTYRYGRGGREQHPLGYAVLALLRGGTREAWRAARRGRAAERLWPEAAVLLAALATAAWWAPGYLLGFHLPVFWLASCLGALSNYYQHAGTGRGRRAGGAVSHYGRLYNRLCCNEGFHEEHHRQPGLHWTRRPALRVSGTPASAWPPVLGFMRATERGAAAFRLPLPHQGEREQGGTRRAVPAPATAQVARETWAGRSSTVKSWRAAASICAAATPSPRARSTPARSSWVRAVS
jgi:fatty acid desaturase